MKNKTLRLFTAILSLLILTVCAFACAITASFTLKQKEYWLDRYEEVVVELEKGDSSALTWISANENIVTVEAGRLIAQGKGKTTVSVSDGKTTEEIAVTVRNSGVRPKIGFTELNAYVGVPTEIPGLLNYGGKDMYASIQYTVELEDNSYMRVDGNTIEGLTVGEVKGTISATWKGLKLSQNVTFHVYESVYMTTESDTVEIHNVDSKLGKAPLGIHLFELDDEISELIEYNIASGEEFIRIEDGMVYAKAEGQAEVVATYSKNGINATASVQVNVLPNYVEGEMVKPITPYQDKITYEPCTQSVGGRQSDNMYAYCAGETVKSDNCFEHRVVNKDVDVKIMDLYRTGYRYFTFDVYYTSNENLMVGCHNKTYWLGVGNVFRSDYLRIITDGKVTNCLEKNKWNTLCYDLRGLWEIGYGLPANIFYFVNDATSVSYIMNVRYYLDDKFIPDENRVYEDKGDYVQATNDEFDIAVPVSKSYSTKTGEPAIVVTEDSVPTYAPYEGDVDGRTDAYLYYTQSVGKETNALVVSTSMNTTYADGIWRMSQKGDYLAWDIYPQEGSTITFSMNGGKKTIAVQVGETNVFEEESWFTVIKDGKKQSVLTAGEWQTVVIAFVDNYDDTSALSNITFSVNEANVSTYVANVRYYKNNSFIPTAYADEKYAPYIVGEGEGVTLGRMETGSFKGAYEYVNANENGGALSFKGIKTEDGAAGAFFTQGYKFIKYYLYLDSNVQSITISATGANHFTETLAIGEDLPTSRMYVFNADEMRAAAMSMGKWYTLYIPVEYTDGDEIPEITFSVNGGTQDVPAKAYMKYVTFEHAVNVPTLNAGSFVSHLVALEYQKDGEFAGSWKYINKSCGGDEGVTKNWGESGVSFSRVCDATSNKPGAYFKEGYQWVKVDFYMTDSVSSFSIRFSAGKNNAYWIQNIPLNDLVAENVYVTDLDGERLNRVPVGEWFTLYVPVDILSVDDNYYMVSVYTNGGSEETPAIAYVKNIKYLMSYDIPAYPVDPVEPDSSAVSVHLRMDGNAVVSGMSLEMQKDGDFAGAYKYVNGQLGRAGNYSHKYGELGLAFNEVYNANLGYNAELQPFFTMGYQYVKLDFYAESSVYSIDFRNGNTANVDWLMEVKSGVAFTSSVFEIYDANGAKVNKWTAGEWYTLLIKPIEGNMLFVQTNAQTADSEAPVMYVKNLSYETENPFVRKTMVVNTAFASLEMQTEGDFAGAYKYTNTSLGTVAGKYGDAGIHFDEIFNANTGHSTAFTDAGYQYVVLDFYATESVYSISLVENWMSSADRVFTLTVNDTLVSDMFAIYDANGNRVDKWTVGAWYTLVIKPHEEAQGGWTYPLRIQTNAETNASEAPVMYVKNLSYKAENPYAPKTENATLYVRGDKGQHNKIVYQKEGDFANCWKFENGNYTSETQSGFMFDKLQLANGTRITDFFDGGYQYIVLQFYVETATVDSLDLRHGDKTDRYFTNGTSCEKSNGEVFTVYDAEGNVVTALNAGEWYTLVIKPELYTDGKASGVYINLREMDSTQTVPVMYVKDASYSVEKPYAEN